MDKVKNGCLWVNIFVVVSFLSIFSGCAYYEGSTSFLPTYVRKIHIMPFTNKSFRPQLEQVVTLELINQFIAQGWLIPSDKKDAEVILSGEIAKYDIEPLSYNEKMNIEKYKIRIVANVWLREAKQNKIVWYEEDVEVSTTVSSSNGIGEVKLESEAVNSIIRELAGKIVKRVVEGWK